MIQKTLKTKPNQLRCHSTIIWTFTSNAMNRSPNHAHLSRRRHGVGDSCGLGVAGTESVLVIDKRRHPFGFGPPGH